MFFRDIVGHVEIKQRLIESAKTDRVSHAELFSGALGRGALPLAIAYSRYLYCQERTNEDACGRCSSCLKFDNLTHPDVHFSFPIVLSSKTRSSDDFISDWRKMIQEQPYFNLEDWTSFIGEKGKQPVIGKDESQEIIKKLNLKSFEGGYKIVILWMAEKMNIAASNKLLKILEEPPQKTLFFLISEDVEQLLPTIISRTQNIPLQAVHDGELEKYLLKKGVESQKVSDIVNLANGDVRMANHLIDDEAQVESNFSVFVEWMRICYKKDVVAVIDWVEEAATLGRENHKSLLKYALHMFRQCIVGNYAGDSLQRLRKEEQNFVNKFSPFINGRNIVELSNVLNEAHYHIERNGNAKPILLDTSFIVLKLLRK